MKGLKKQLGKGQMQEQVPQEMQQDQDVEPQQATANSDELAGIIAQLDPSEQEQFFQMDSKQQQEALNSMLEGGNNNE